jgi:predicted ferric reductase
MQRIPRAPVKPVDGRAVGRAGLFGLLGVNVLIVTLFFLQAGPSANALITVARLFAVYSFLALAFQLLLAARVPWLDRRVGADRLTTIHRWTGCTVLCTLTAHILLVISGYAELDRTNAIAEFLDLAGTQVSILAGAVAFGLIVVVGLTSARIARTRLPYEAWHAMHFLTYAAVVLAFTHALTQTTTFAVSPLAKGYLWTVWIGALGSVLVFRFLLPLIRNARHQFRVAAVVPESPDVVSVYVTGRDLHKLPAVAGQFFVWRFQMPGRRFRANPFSLSAAPDGRHLRLTAKAVGTGSAGLRALRPGTRVFAAGPYGAFTHQHRTRENALLIAGGIGITPIRALLESVTGHVVLLYRVRDQRDAVLLGELRHLAHMRGATLHVLAGPTASYRYGPPLGPAAVHGMVPDVSTRDVFVCGPAGMTSTVLATMRTLNVPAKQIHSERFVFAG